MLEVVEFFKYLIFFYGGLFVIMNFVGVVFVFLSVIYDLFWREWREIVFKIVILVVVIFVVFVLFG